jgi:hypothetical protein
MIVVAFLIEMFSGLVGGAIAGVLMKDKSLGLLWDSVAGFLGGAAGGALALLIPAFGTAVRGGSDAILAILAEVAAGLVGGAAVMLIAALVKYLAASRR